jgi:hypothetical protein
MKRKPDAMIALIVIFFIGLVISGFTSMGISSDKSTVTTQHSIEVSVIRY